MITLTKSENYKEEYSCSIVQIGELFPIEGSDFLAKTLINGFSIVVRKDEVHTGDVMFYVANECQINHNFLAKNNLYEDYHYNSNVEEYEKVLAEKGKDEARKLCGYVPKTGRIRIIKLRGCPSMGVLFSRDSMAKWKSGFKDFDINSHIGEFFDTINDDLFVKAYVPFVPEVNRRNRNSKRNKKLARFDRLIAGQFRFHYDTNQLQVNMHNINPEDSVCISVKMHGTSAIFGNVLVKKPISMSLGQKAVRKQLKYQIKLARKQKNNKRVEKFMKILKPNYTIGYGNIYSSRTVIKNQYINSKVTKGFYNTDVWGYINDIIKNYIPKDMLIYGEIVGYLPNNFKMVQKDYDYGCDMGTCKLMIYRIVMNRPNQEPLELDVKDVLAWTNTLIKKEPKLKEFIYPIPILYNGTLKDLYPEIDTNWHENVLEALKVEKRFGMEENEPLNKKAMPREGIVVRIDKDKIPRAFKLKCIKYIEKESKNVDKGEVDIEMIQTDY